MDVLDAIMKIVSDMFSMNDIPAGTTDMIVGGMTSFFRGIMFVFDLLQKLFGMATAA